MSRATQARVAKRLAAKGDAPEVATPIKAPAIQGEVFSIRAEDAFRFGFHSQIVLRLTSELAAAQRNAKASTQAVIDAASEGGKYNVVQVDPESATVTRVLNPDYKAP